MKLLPDPHGGIEGFATVAFLGRSSSSQHMANGVRGKPESEGAQVESQSMSSVAGLVPSLQDLLVDVARGLRWGVIRTATATFQARESLRFAASEPLPDHLPGGPQATGCVADAPRLVIGRHKLKSCLDPGHSVAFPVGEACHSGCSCRMRYSHPPFARGVPDLATVFLTTSYRCLRATTFGLGKPREYCRLYVGYRGKRTDCGRLHHQERGRPSKLRLTRGSPRCVCQRGETVIVRGGVWRF